MFITSKIQLSIQKARNNLAQLLSKFANLIARKLVFGHLNFIQYLALNSDRSFKKRQLFLQSLIGGKHTVFFVFRDLHLIDWFLPIHKALRDNYSKEIDVLYINFGSTLKKAGPGFEHLPYLNAIEKRISVIPDAIYQHFSDQEINLFKTFPVPDLIITSETIRQENFSARERVYLPHYSVPKANDTLPGKIKYNHVFLPAKTEFSYKSLLHPENQPIKLHEVGYPKLHPVEQKSIRLFNNSNPVVIFAPSLSIQLIEGYLKKGILDVFKKLRDINVIIKLHPTLSSKMHTLNRYLEKVLAHSSSIIIDTKTSIQELGEYSALLITDFGSIGAEYRLGFGKRVIYLKIPVAFEGGGDLLFRDQFADEIVDIEDLNEAILNTLQKESLEESEINHMRDRVLFNWRNADQVAADQIHRILQRP